jgi:hypothetical protein
MAKALPIVLGLAATIVTGGAAIPGVAAAIGLSAGTISAIGVGIGLAGTLAASLLAQTPPKPKMQDGDVSIKQAIPPRVRGYGRARVGGTFDFYDSTPDGDLKTLIVHVAHEVDDSTELSPNPEENWLNDERVQLDEDGNVTDDPWWQEDDDDSVVVIQHYLGAPTQVIPSFDEKWTADHKGHGLCCSYVKYADLKDEEQIKAFPSGPPPYRAVLRLAKIFDPRIAGTNPGEHNPANEATWTWSDNSALAVLDFLTRKEQGIPVGFGISFDRVDAASFAFAANVCDQSLPLKSGGVEKRWRTWGLYELTEDRKAVLQDLLDACNGRLIQGPDGRIGLTVGAGRYRATAEDPYTVPTGIPASTVTLNDDQILEYDFSTGKAAIERINEVRATYVSQAWEWAETEAGIQEDVASQERNGVESSQIKLRFVPSEGQAQRVARYTLKHGNPRWSGRIRGTLALLDAWGERWITLTIGELAGLTNVLFEINSMRIDRATMTVEAEVQSYDDWWDWTASTDEADPAIPPPNTDEDNDVPVPQHVVVTVEHRPLNNGTLAAVGVISWDPPPRSVYVGRARYRPVTEPTPSVWQERKAEQDEFSIDTDPLIDGQQYEAQAKFIGPRGSPSDWSDSTLFTAVADPVAPSPPTFLSATPSGANVDLVAVAANSSNQRFIRFWRDSDATFAGAIDISGPIWTGPNGIATFTDTPGLGAWRYWATAGNWSGIESAPTGPQAVTFTPAAPVIVSPATPYVTSDNTPTFSGTGPNGTTIHLFDGVTDVGSVAVVAGAWAITASTLADGVRNVTAKAVAPGGATSVASNTVVTTIDTVSQVPVITTASPINTTDTTPDISGTSEAGAAISVYRGGSTLAGTATADGSGNWTSTLSTLAVGAYSITAKAIDALGNPQSAASSPAKTLNVNPLAPAISTSSATIGNSNPVVAGTSTASASIGVYADGVLNQTVSADGSGNWTATLSGLTAGARSITARQTVAGLTSADSTAITLTVVWYDPDAYGHADFKGGNYRLAGAGSTLAGIFDTVTTSSQIVTNADGSLHQIAANAAPLCDRGIELWEPRTNRCTNRNANPVDLTGVTLSGDVLATLTRVDDSSAMGAGTTLGALLTAATINGFVYKLDNSAGSTDAFATISGTINVTGACRGSIVYRGSAGRIEIGGATAVSFGASTPYVRAGGSRTAAATSEQMRVVAPAGAVIYFILNQLEAGAFDTAPIVVNAAIATRNSPLITRAVTAGVDFSATEGFFGLRGKVASSGVTNSGIAFGSLQTTIGDCNVIQFVTSTAVRGLTQVAAAATGLASQSLTATNLTTGVYGYKANDFGFSANGLTTVTDVSGALPTGTPAKITLSINSGSALNGVIEQVKWGTTKPSTATIQAKSGWTTVS